MPFKSASDATQHFLSQLRSDVGPDTCLSVLFCSDQIRSMMPASATEHLALSSFLVLLSLSPQTLQQLPNQPALKFIAWYYRQIRQISVELLCSPGKTASTNTGHLFGNFKTSGTDLKLSAQSVGTQTTVVASWDHLELAFQTNRGTLSMFNEADRVVTKKQFLALIGSAQNNNCVSKLFSIPGSLELVWIFLDGCTPVSGPQLPLPPHVHSCSQPPIATTQSPVFQMSSGLLSCLHPSVLHCSNVSGALNTCH